MKILFIIQGMQSGGAERVMSVLCNMLSNKGHDVFLGLTERVDNYAYNLDERVKVIDLRCKRRSTIEFFLNSAMAIRKAMNSCQPDVVISFITRANICTILGSIGKRIPVIVSERNNPEIDPPSIITRTLRHLTYPLAKGYVFQTNFAKNYFGKSIRKKGVVIYNPIDESNLLITKTERLNRIIAVGRLEPQKNFPMLINAFAKVHMQYPNYTLDIYGEGSLLSNLQMMIDELNLHNIVTLRGHTDNTFAELRKSKIFALTSNYEGMPNALIEAMCMGCACIATDAPAYGARELIDDSVNGFLIPVGDEQLLIERLITLMNNDSLQIIMGQEAEKVCDKVNADQIIGEWLDYIKKVVNNY